MRTLKGTVGQASTMGNVIAAGSKKSPGVPDTGNTAAPTLASPNLTATATAPVFRNDAVNLIVYLVINDGCRC